MNLTAAAEYIVSEGPRQRKLPFQPQEITTSKGNPCLLYRVSYWESSTSWVKSTFSCIPLQRPASASLFSQTFWTLNVILKYFPFPDLSLRTWQGWPPPSWTHLTPLASMMFLLIYSGCYYVPLKQHLFPCSLSKIHSSLFTVYNPFQKVFTQSHSIRSLCSSSVHPQKIPVYMPRGIHLPPYYQTSFLLTWIFLLIAPFSGIFWLQIYESSLTCLCFPIPVSGPFLASPASSTCHQWTVNKTCLNEC